MYDLKGFRQAFNLTQKAIGRDSKMSAVKYLWNGKDYERLRTDTEKKAGRSIRF